MSKNRDQKTLLDEEIDLQQSYNKAEDFISDNRNMIGVIVAVIALGLIGFFWFTNIYLAGQESEAQEQMFVAEKSFKNGDFKKALEGDGNYPGFVEIIESYSGMTNAVNLAHYYAGISSLNTGDFQGAINYLSDFNGKDEVLSSMALGAIGDANMELGNKSAALSNYKSAANNSENGFSAPLFLMKAGNVLELNGDKAGAKALYERIKKEYGQSTQAQTIDKYIIRTGV